MKIRSSKRREARRLLARVFTTQEDLDSFCVDYYPDIYRRFSPQMTTTARENLLIQLVKDPQELIDNIKSAVHEPDTDISASAREVQDARKSLPLTRFLRPAVLFAGIGVALYLGRQQLRHWMNTSAGLHAPTDLGQALSRVPGAPPSSPDSGPASCGGISACGEGVQCFALPSGKYSIRAMSHQRPTNTCEDNLPVEVWIPKEWQIMTDDAGNTTIAADDVFMGAGPIRCNTGQLTMGPAYHSDGIYTWIRQAQIVATIPKDNRLELAVQIQKSDWHVVHKNKRQDAKYRCQLEYFVVLERQPE